jgi:hypothetical protein
MFLQRAFKINVVVTTGVVLLLVLPLSGVCQSDAVQTQESSEPIEEIVVHGHKSIIDLKYEMYEAEETLYDVYNSLNSDDDYDIRCYKEAPTGSKIKRRVCRTEKLGDILAGRTQRMMRGEPYVSPTAEIKKMKERMLAEMTELASTHPEYLKALESYDAKKKTWESERKRRCEGRIFICRQQ